MEIIIRRVGMEDHINIVKLFQTFDHEKYKFIQLPELQNNNTTSNKTSLSLAGLRIDERGGIYLNPLLDSNSAYFKCYVAEDMKTCQLIGYVLFFNTLDEKGGGGGGGGATSPSNSSSTGGGSVSSSSAGHDDPVAVIEDLFVKPSYRGRGIATQLWRKVLKSSLERGCFSCECVLIPQSREGLRFWTHRIGSEKINSLLHQQKLTESSQQELIIELSRQEMKMFFEQTAIPEAAKDQI